MNARNQYIFYTITLFLLTSCLDSYWPHSRSKKLVLKSYSMPDSIIIRNYIFCNVQSTNDFFSRNTVVELDGDSVMQVFKKSMSKLDMPVITFFDFKKNYCDSTIQNIRYLTIRRIDLKQIKEIAETEDRKTVLVPFVFVDNRIRFTGYVTSLGMAGHNGFSVVSHLFFICFIVQGGEIIYQKHMRYVSNRTRADNWQQIEAVPSMNKVKQQHWDELVRRTMHDYIKRLQ